MARKMRVTPPTAVPEGFVLVGAVSQLQEGSWYRLRGAAQVQTSSLLLKADEIDYDRDTGDAEARGNVYLQNFEGGEELWADRVEYNIETETGKFYNVKGTSPVEMAPRPGILFSTNPFHFEGKWAERLQEKYVLHEGFITNCKMPKPLWVLKGPVFDIVPNDRAIAYRSVFWMRWAPIFYTPFFYKSLEKLPRRSGFLTPNFGNSSRRGKTFGAGYYWAINRSYDATYIAQYFSKRGIAQHVDFRGKPTATSDFNAIIYGVNDRLGQGGLLASVDARADLGHGFNARVDARYLSSFTFRREFSESLDEMIQAEVHSVGYVTKNWSTYGLNLVMQRNENFQSTLPGDTIVIRKLPEVSFTSRDRQIWGKLPLWISWDSSAGLLRRTQLLFQTRQLMERIDLYPRVTTALRWKDFSLIPSVAVRETHYGESRSDDGSIVGRNVNRGAREFDVTLVPPSVSRVFGGTIKHVIEPRISYRYVTGITDFDRYVRFDETELYSNTNELEMSITNRIFAKRGGNVDEILSWQVWQKRYFDPTFGGAVVEGQRNTVLSALDLTPYAFIDGPRNYSPVVSVLRMSPMSNFGLEWRTDYDPLRHMVVNSGVGADMRIGEYSFSLLHNTLRGVPLLSPPSNQFSGQFRIGNENRRGWNAGFLANYDFKYGIMRFATTQLTYNSDCCGFSIQYRRIGLQGRNENQYMFSFSVANLGSVGTLKRQEPLDLIRAQMGITGPFEVLAMRYFTGPEVPWILSPRPPSVERWYVKARLLSDPTFAGR
jgi:LPS-assembly protein